MTPLVRATRDTWRLCCALRKHMEKHPDATMLDVLKAACDGDWSKSDADLLRGLG